MNTIYLIFYDISQNKLRTQAAKLLEREGYERIQFSVFMGTQNPEKNRVWQKLRLAFKEQTNEKIFCIKLNKQNFYSMKIIGTFETDLAFLCGDKSSLTL